MKDKLEKLFEQISLREDEDTKEDIASIKEKALELLETIFFSYEYIHDLTDKFRKSDGTYANPHMEKIYLANHDIGDALKQLEKLLGATDEKVVYLEP